MVSVRVLGFRVQNGVQGLEFRVLQGGEYGFFGETTNTANTVAAVFDALR